MFILLGNQTMNVQTVINGVVYLVLGGFSIAFFYLFARMFYNEYKRLMNLNQKPKEEVEKKDE